MDIVAANEEKRSVILVADDDEASLLVIQAILERDGYTVETAHDGKEVMDKCRELTPDLVLMDAIMPEMDGFDATRKLMDKFNSDLVPVLMITSLNDDESVDRAYEAGAIDFIPKPIHWPVLLKRVERLLYAKQVSTELGHERQRAEEEKERYENRLRQAYKMEAIGRLAGGVAHDFNNILTAIVGYVDLASAIASKNDDEKIVKYLKEIGRASDRARGLVRQMLDYSRKGGRRREMIAVPELVTEVVTLFKSILPSAIHVDLKVSAELLYIMADPVQLHQVIMNLCVNARDAMGGRGDIRIKVEQALLNDCACSSCFKLFSGDFVKISIADTGSGIDEVVVGKIFDPFFTTKDIGQGTGMGLSVVHGIIHHFEGHIVVTSEVGKGSCFDLYLPMVEAKKGNINN